MGDLEDNGIDVAGVVREDAAGSGPEPQPTAPPTPVATDATVAPVATGAEAAAGAREAPFIVRLPPLGQSMWRDVHGDAYLAMRRRVADDALIADVSARLRAANRSLGGGDADAAEGNAVSAGRTPLGDYLVANARQGLWYSIPGQVRARFAERDEHPSEPSADELEARSRVSGIPVDQLRANWRERAAAMDITPAPLLTEEEWRASAWYRGGLSYTPDMTERAARVRAEYHDQNQLDRWLIEHRHAGVFDGLLGFLAGMAGSAADPTNYIAGSAAARGALLVRATDLARARLGPRLGNNAATGIGIAGARMHEGFHTGMPASMAQQMLLAPSLADYGEATTVLSFLENSLESGLWSAAISGAISLRVGGFRYTLRSVPPSPPPSAPRASPSPRQRVPDTTTPLGTDAERRAAVQPFLRAAEDHRTALDDMLRDATRGLRGVEQVPARVKSEQEAADKLVRGGAANNPRHPEELGDYLGGRIIIDRMDALPRILQRLQAERNRVVNVENFLNSPRPSGYRAVHVQVRMPSGFTAEVQLVPRGMANVADEAHALYRRTRNLPDESQRTPAQRRIHDESQRAERALQRHGAAQWYAATEPPIRVPRPAPQPPAPQQSDDQDNPTR